MSMPVRLVLVCAVAAYAAVLVFVLLSPSAAVPSGLVDRTVSLGVFFHAPAPLVVPARVEFGLNVLAFVPLSLAGSFLRPAVTVSTWTAAGFAASLLVEATQVALPERSATHSDVVANTLGAALGALLGWVAVRLLERQSQ